MKKSKIILLTVLIMLVIYCGAVIYVTKPEGFDISSFFNVSATITETEKADMKAELKAELKDEFKSEIKAEIKADQIKAEIKAELENELLGEFEDELNVAVNAAVDKKVSSSFDALEVEMKDSMNKLLEDLKAELEAEISKDVLDQLEIDLNALAAQLYTTYKDDLVQSITPEVLEAVLAQLKTEKVAKESSPEVEEDYYTIRERIRNEEINDVLSQLN